MSTLPPVVTAVGRRAQRRAGRRAAALLRPTGYRIEALVVDDVPGLVGTIGGWLCDHAMAGWSVYVDVIGANGFGALAILGLGLQPRMAVVPEGERVCILVAAHDLLSDPGIRDRVADALHRGDDVVVWDERRDAKLEYPLRHVRYQVSAAAAAFKEHALRALGVAVNAPEGAEVFRAHSGSRVSAVTSRD